MNSLIVALLMLGAAGDRPDLAGVVAAKGGAPVAGAHVLIAEAGVRQGSSPFCPSCYADCGKQAETAADGSFGIKDLDPTLLFRVLVVAEGSKPAFVAKVDPAKGPIRAELVPFDLKQVPANRVVRGRVVDAAGRPVAGATVEAEMFRTEEFSGFSPGIFDPLAISNLAGEFALVSRSPIRDVSVKVAARGLAPRIFAKQVPAPTPTRYELGPGATVAGRVLAGGKPLGGVSVGLVQADRSIGKFLGPVEIGTDAEGRFVFPNVGPGEGYFVYGIMTSLGNRGAVAARRVEVGLEGATVAVGDLAVEAGHKLGGQEILADGKPIPPRTRVRIGRQEAWDSQSATLDADGRFALAGLPTEEFSLSVQVRGYRLARRNKSFDTNNPFQLKGFVDADLTGLKVLLEPE